jgi:hypothetical protein
LNQQSQQQQICNNTSLLPPTSSEEAQKKRSLDLIRAHIASSIQAPTNAVNHAAVGVASELSGPSDKVMKNEAKRNNAAVVAAPVPAAVLGPPQNWSLEQLGELRSSL